MIAQASRVGCTAQLRVATTEYTKWLFIREAFAESGGIRRACSPKRGSEVQSSKICTGTKIFSSDFWLPKDVRPAKNFTLGRGPLREINPQPASDHVKQCWLSSQDAHFHTQREFEPGALAPQTITLATVPSLRTVASVNFAFLQIWWNFIFIPALTEQHLQNCKFMPASCSGGCSA
ncbi:hypothetical protein TSPI_00151 [Trichinella spiralis]|uniref:Uncharacterized protein n=1 Tax=Trichinella spiralis TaxID=6334 RepID=A0ABR3KQS7_TRISP